MGLYNNFLTRGVLFKATPKKLGDNEFLTVTALDPYFAEEWKEVGVGRFPYIEGKRVKTIWHYTHYAFPYPVMIPEGSLVQLEKTGDKIEVVGVLDAMSALDYNFTRLVPEAIEPQPAPAVKKK